MAVGSALSTAAPSFALLAAAQGLLGIGIGLLVAVGIAAAGVWPVPDRRAHVLACAIAGMPAAWITGMPVVGLVAEIHWRLAWVAVPTVVALAAVDRCCACVRRTPPRDGPATRSARGGVPTSPASRPESCWPTRPGRAC